MRPSSSRLACVTEKDAIYSSQVKLLYKNFHKRRKLNRLDEDIGWISARSSIIEKTTTSVN